jgi:hypothetical protein
VSPRNLAVSFFRCHVRIKSNFMVDVGLGWDWDGPLVEENGLLANFYSKSYQYNKGL